MEVEMHPWATVSMVLGLCSLILGWIPFVGWAIVLCSLVFGFLSFSEIKHNPKKYKGKDRAVTGIILSLYVLITTIILATISVALIATAVPLLGATDGYTFNFNCVKGTGSLLAQNRDVEAFNAIDVSEQVTVYVTQSPNTTVRVEADQNIVHDIRTEFVDGTLHVNTAGLCFKPLRTIKVYATTPSISNIDASSGAKIFSIGNLTTDTMTLRSATASSIDVNLVANTVYADATEAGQVDLHGTAVTLDAVAKTAGIIDAEQLQTRDAILSTRTAGIITTNSLVSVDATARTGGEIYYLGSPQLDAQEYTGGIIEQVINE